MCPHGYHHSGSMATPVTWDTGCAFTHCFGLHCEVHQSALTANSERMHSANSERPSKGTRPPNPSECSNCTGSERNIQSDYSCALMAITIVAAMATPALGIHGMCVYTLFQDCIVKSPECSNCEQWAMHSANSERPSNIYISYILVIYILVINSGMFRLHECFLFDRSVSWGQMLPLNQQKHKHWITILHHAYMSLTSTSNSAQSGAEFTVCNVCTDHGGR